MTRTNDRPLTIAHVNPLQGSLGIIGVSAELCARLAVEEVNAEGGVLGRELALRTVDAGGPPRSIAGTVRGLALRGEVEAVVGAHPSNVRAELAPAVSGLVPYVYTSLYEGGERTPGVFVTGETPELQVVSAMRLLARERGIRRWCVVGNDYVWPRGTVAHVRGALADSPVRLGPEFYVPLGTDDFTTVLDRVARCEADGVLLLLVGLDGVHFHRQFAQRGMHAVTPRLTPLLEENMLMAAGPDATSDLYAAAGYFSSLPTVDNLEFAARFARRFGLDAPSVGSMAESCYEGIKLFAALANRARSTDVGAVSAVADVVAYEGARGAVRLRAGHTEQRVFLARAEGMDFSVLAEIRPGR